MIVVAPVISILFICLLQPSPGDAVLLERFLHRPRCPHACGRANHRNEKARCAPLTLCDYSQIRQLEIGLLKDRRWTTCVDMQVHVRWTFRTADTACWTSALIPTAKPSRSGDTLPKQTRHRAGDHARIAMHAARLL